MNGFYNNTNCRFDGSQITLPKLLQAAGYQTAIIGKWHSKAIRPDSIYWNILPGQGEYYNPPMIVGLGTSGQRTSDGYVTDIITDDTLDWLQDAAIKAKPFLLMCHHKAPHRDWEPALRHLGALTATGSFPSRRRCSTIIRAAARPSTSRT